MSQFELDEAIDIDELEHSDVILHLLLLDSLLQLIEDDIERDQDDVEEVDEVDEDEDQNIIDVDVEVAVFLDSDIVDDMVLLTRLEVLDEELDELEEAEVTIVMVLDDYELCLVLIEHLDAMQDEDDDDNELHIPIVEITTDVIEDETDDNVVEDELVLQPHIEVDDEVLLDAEIIEEADVNEYSLWDIIKIVDMTFLDDVNMNVETIVYIVLQAVEH